MIELKCELHIPSQPGLKDDEVTVGRILESKCLGKLPEDFNELQAGFKHEPGNELNKESALKLLKINKNDQDINFIWTIYKTGPIKIPSLIVTDGQNEFSLGSQELNVVSVIEKTDQPPKPFGMLFPLSIPIPILYFAIVFLATTVIVASLIQYVYKRLKYRKVRDSLKKYDSAVDPDLQFYRSLRAAEKKVNPVSEIEKAFYVYLSRRCRFPILEIGPEKSLQFHKIEMPNQKKLRAQIKKAIEEINHIKTEVSLPEEAQVNQLTPKLFRFIDDVEANLERLRTNSDTRGGPR